MFISPQNIPISSIIRETDNFAIVLFFFPELCGVAKDTTKKETSRIMFSEEDKDKILYSKCH